MRKLLPVYYLGPHELGGQLVGTIPEKMSGGYPPEIFNDIFSEGEPPRRIEWVLGCDPEWMNMNTDPNGPPDYARVYVRKGSTIMPDDIRCTHPIYDFDVTTGTFTQRPPTLEPADFTHCACGQQRICPVCGFGWGILPCECGGLLHDVVGMFYHSLEIAANLHRSMGVREIEDGHLLWQITNNPRAHLFPNSLVEVKA